MTLEAIIAVAFAFALILLLVQLSRRTPESWLDASGGEDWGSRDAEGNLRAWTAECVERIFSRADQKFVRATRSPALRKLFRRERKSLAHFWVNQTDKRIQAILKEHVETARQSRELELKTEASILLRYAELRMLCSAMGVCIELAGPERLKTAAHYAMAVSERLGEAQRSMAMTARSRAMENAGPR